MRIGNVVIKNFRAIEELHFELNSRVNVIVGPNVVGKTTVLQAIRLAKSLIAPRSANEAQQTLISLGAVSPHFPQRVHLPAPARDTSKPIEIRCTYHFSDAEIDIILAARQDIIRSAVQAGVGQSFTNPAALIQFMSSMQGQEATRQAGVQFEPTFRRLTQDRHLIIGLHMEVKTTSITATDPTSGPILQFLDQRLPPHQTVFSYFPADRALPMGEVAIQLGAADIQQQIESHNSQPQVKYTRLKNTIFNTLVMGQDERDSLLAEFAKIFTHILRSRKIHSIGINELGLLSIMIEDIETNRVYEIDSLSSGEKGLALTFLLIAKSLSSGGIVILDEPELHLNPAVCKDVLSFVIEFYAVPNDLQFIMCTHSPEILSGAFSNESCSLYHVVSERNVTKVGSSAIDEYSEALQRLGTSVSESLLYKGTLFVEGDDDVAFLETGFPNLLKRFKIKDRGGRKEVEKTAERIQALEAKGEKVEPIFLIFDRDDIITSLRNSNSVRLLQWGRRCLENYLIDLEVLARLLKDEEITTKPVANEGELANTLRTIAFAQIPAVAARATYNKLGYQNASLRVEDVVEKSMDKPLVGIVESLYARAKTAKDSIAISSEESWKSSFLLECKKERDRLEASWEATWKESCDGKKLFESFHKVAGFRLSLSSVKRKIIQEMRNTSSENWRLVESLLKQLIGSH